MDVVILLGAPGSGKGTIAEKIEAATDYIHVSTGDMLREAVKNGTEVGHEAESYMKRGELVPDEVMIRVVEERLAAGASSDKYLLDGFPRTAAQAQMLSDGLKRHDGSVSYVFQLDCPRDVLIKRLTGRRVCRACGATFHVINIPPRREGVCDACGGELYQRADDCEATIINRLDVYTRQTESLIALYDAQGLTKRVDSNQSADALVSEMIAIMKDGDVASGAGA